jgi:predicted DNA binding protein
LRVRGPEATAFVDAIRGDVTIRDELAGDRERVAITDCLAEDYATVDPLVAAPDCVLVPPLTYVEGDRLLRVLALDGDRLAGLFEDLHAEWSVDVVRKESAVDASAAMPGGCNGSLDALTDRQREALSIAVERGYYELPREMTTAEIGAAMGIDRRTAEEHLRRAERRLLTDTGSGIVR